MNSNRKECHDKCHRVHDLSSLSPHDYVFVNDDRNNCKTGEIVESKSTPRSYTVKTDNRVLSRNRKHLTAIPCQQEP